MTPFTVSVVIPSYKRHKEVIRAVRSVLAQTLPPVEVIVSNDGHDPEKKELLQTIEDNRVRYVEAPRKGNASATRNFGIQRANGNWVALLDDDDVWLPDKLKSQFEQFEKSGRDEAILGGVERVYLKNGKIKYRPKAVHSNEVTSADLLFSETGSIHTSTIIAPAKVFRKHPFNEKLDRHEDWEWLLEAGECMPVVLTNHVVCERWILPGEGLSRQGGFDYAWSWYQRNHHRIHAANRTRFVCTILARKASYDHKFSAIPVLLIELRDNGSLKLFHCWRLAVHWGKGIRIIRGFKNSLDTNQLNDA